MPAVLLSQRGFTTLPIVPAFSCPSRKLANPLPTDPPLRVAPLVGGRPVWCASKPSIPGTFSEDSFTQFPCRHSPPNLRLCVPLIHEIEATAVGLLST